MLFRSKGLNKIKVYLDPDNTIDEMCENNNFVTKEYFIYEDEIRPVYPYDYSIINKNNIKFYASTANPFSKNREYIFQIDTTLKFNSPILSEQKIISSGGVVEFSNSSFTMTSNYVYYWRVGVAADNGIVKWNHFSFKIGRAHV